MFATVRSELRPSLQAFMIALEKTKKEVNDGSDRNEIDIAMQKASGKMDQCQRLIRSFSKGSKTM